ncbi:MAG: hypothetical protein ACHP7H_01330 [Hyphomicrobiales bacterium]
MRKPPETTWQRLPLEIVMVQPNFLGTGKGAIVARFAALKDAQAMQRCFWRKGLELRTAAGKLLANDKPARRTRNKFHRSGSAATARKKAELRKRWGAKAGTSAS